MKERKYLRPTNGATVTVFAPYDCGNRCPFCINKKDYLDNPVFNFDNVLTSMETMGFLTPKCDFVFTGGEPLADMNLLVKMLDLIKELNKRGHEHKLFINTTLPNPEGKIEILNKYKDIITMINISRHIRKYVTECDDSYFSQLEVPVRINCVLYNEKEALEGHKLIERYLGKYPCIKGIQFRDNYIGVTEANLFNQNNNKVLANLIKDLKINKDEVKINLHTFRWNAELADNIKFHRTQCFSKIITENTVFIGDVIIDPRGLIKDDWNEHGSPLDLTKYKEAEEI